VERSAHSVVKSRRQKAEGRRGSRILLPSAFCLLTCVAPAVSAQDFKILGYLNAREIYVKAPPSWTHGSFGRFDVGADSGDDSAFRNTASAQIGAEWSPTPWLTAHAQVIARAEPSGTQGKRVGAVEAYADFHTERWRLRAGEFFLPTSRENTDPLWTSPYTITFSALNTWMGQEVRPIGADLQFSPSFYATVGATAFRGNDTMGTVPSARGWTFGNRLSVYDEDVAVPPPQGSVKPVGPDLDGKWGFSERVRLQLPERAMLQVTHLDNRSELVNRRGQVPWQTNFNHVGAQLGTTGPATLAAEWMSGETTVGFPGGTFTLDYTTIYLLGSYKMGQQRLSARVERFATRNHARSNPDFSREHGHAVTIAWFHEPGDHARYGVEFVKVNGNHPGAAGIGVPLNTGGTMITAEARYKF
jgi:hypothetical protein